MPWWLLLSLGAFAQAPDGFPVQVEGQTVTTLAAAPLATAQGTDGRLFVLEAGGALGCWEQAEGRWTHLWSRSLPDAVGLFSASGRVWVELLERRAQPLEAALSIPEGLPAVAAQPAAAPPAAAWTVASVSPGDAVIQVEAGAQIPLGTHVRFLGVELQELPSLEGGPAEQREVVGVAGTGRVVRTEADRAMVELTRGSRVGPGDAAERLDRRLGYQAAPARLGGVGEVGAVLRPLLALDTVGVALINEAWFTWWFDAPWYSSVHLSPFGLGWSKDGNPITVAATASGGFDNRWFSVGLGAGWSMLNGDPGGGGFAAQDKGGAGEQLQFEDVTGAFALTQEARLGSRDGLRLAVRNQFLLVPQVRYVWTEACEGTDTYYDDYYYYYQEGCYEPVEEGQEFAFGGIAMRLDVPTGARSDLFVDWGTGGAGATWVTGGVAAWLRGNGDRRSTAIEAAAGYGRLWGQPGDEEVELYGPLVSVGWRRRL